jgi:hypothetical protein
VLAQLTAIVLLLLRADMPDSSTSAFDTYTWDTRAKAWRHYPNALLHYAESGAATVHQPPVLAGEQTTYLIYLPLRNAPASMNITLLGRGTISASGGSAPTLANPPVLWYGTSIQQGGVASRAGNTYDAIISRALSREVINLGFANNGVEEISVGKLLCDIKEAAAIVIDCLPNMNTAQVTNRTAPLVKYLRANGHKLTPIVLAEGTPTPGDWLNSSVNRHWGNGKNSALAAEYDKLIAGGEDPKLLHYVSANQLFSKTLTPGPEGRDTNPTVCGIHSSDLGQYEIAEFYTGFLPTVMR